MAHGPLISENVVRYFIQMSHFIQMSPIDSVLMKCQPLFLRKNRQVFCLLIFKFNMLIYIGLDKMHFYNIPIFIPPVFIC